MILQLSIGALIVIINAVIQAELFNAFARRL